MNSSTQSVCWGLFAAVAVLATCPAKADRSGFGSGPGNGEGGFRADGPGNGEREFRQDGPGNGEREFRQDGPGSGEREFHSGYGQPDNRGPGPDRREPRLPDAYAPRPEFGPPRPMIYPPRQTGCPPPPTPVFYTPPAQTAGWANGRWVERDQRVRVDGYWHESFEADGRRCRTWQPERWESRRTPEWMQR
jgi:hypothetical protein